LIPAEAVAHAAEEFLRQLVRGRATLTPSTLDVLMVATQLIEQIVLAFRQKTALPDTSGMLARLQSLVCQADPAESDHPTSSTSTGQNKSDLTARLEEARSQGRVICNAVFIPNRDLDHRGVNINSVRTRLASLGQILAATPQVRPTGGIAFEFLLGVREVPTD